MTTVTDRLKAAMTGWRTGAHQPTDRKVAPRAGSRDIRLWPDHRNATPLWSMTDVQSFIDYGFNTNAVIYAACMVRVDAVNTAQLRGYTGTGDDPQPLPPTDPLARLLLRPNRFQSAHEFHALNSVLFAIAGQSYVWFRRAKAGAVPDEMYTLRPDWVHIVPGIERQGEVVGYIYAPAGRTIRDGYPMLPEDIMHVKRPNPSDPLMGAGYGFSPLGPAAQSANVDNDVTKFLKVFFQSGAMFQNAVSFDVPMQPEEMARVRERLKEIYGGVSNWNEWGVFDQGAKVQRVSPTFEEMGFDAIDARNEARILMALGVPPILVGARLGLERSTFCLPGTARISTPSGLRRIDDVKAGMTVWSMVDGQIVPRRVTKAGITGTKLVYRVRTKNRILRATDNHPVLVRVPGNSSVSNEQRQATYEWRSIGDLKVGDYIVQPQYYPDQGGDTTPDGDHATADFMQWCGALVGDGTVRANVGVRMAMPPNDRTQPFYVEIARKIFTKQSHASGGDINSQNVVEREPVSIQTRERDFGFSSAQASRKLVELGFGGRALTKRIPGWVFMMRRDLRLAFLAGLVDSDGSIDKRGALTFGLANEDLVHDIRELMLGLGIQCSNIRHQTISPDALPNPGIRDVYHAYAFTASSAVMVDEIPFADPLYRERIKLNAHRNKPCGLHASNPWLSPEIGFYKVVEIEKEHVETVYDITVEGGHCFIADGVLVHNSNYEEARKAFWEDRLLPELRSFESEYNYFLGADGRLIQYDLSDVPALRKDVGALALAAKTLVDTGVPPRLAYMTVGLDVPAYDGDMERYINTGGGSVLTPVSVAADAEQATEAVEDTVIGTGEKTRAVKAYDAAAMGRKMDTLATNWEQRYGDAATDVFAEELRTLKAMLNETLKAAYRQKATPNWTVLTGMIEDWYADHAGEDWRSAFVPLIEGTMIEAGQEWASTLGVAFDVRNLRAEVWFQEYVLKFADPITQTSSDSVKSVIAQAMAEGWTIPQTEERLGLMFQQWMDGDLTAEDFAWMEARLPQHRREAIARTESIRASSQGSLELGKSWGAKRKFWIATNDDRIRDSHASAGAVYNEQNAIPMDQPFMVNGNAMNAPGDPAAPVEEVVNCRCTPGLLMD